MLLFGALAPEFMVFRLPAMPATVQVTRKASPSWYRLVPRRRQLIANLKAICKACSYLRPINARGRIALQPCCCSDTSCSVCGALMHPLQAKYLAAETAISMAINAAISIGFVWLVFHGHDHLPASGPGSLLRDAAPQTFMITRQRMRSGHLDTWHRSKAGATPSYTRKILLRALTLAIAAGVPGPYPERRSPAAVVPGWPALRPRIRTESRIWCPDRTRHYTFGNILGVRRISSSRLRTELRHLYTLYSALIV